jgi:hypothetical protein
VKRAVITFECSFPSENTRFPSEWLRFRRDEGEGESHAGATARTAVGAAGMTTKVSQRAGEPARHGAAPKAAAGERPPSAKGGYKPRRGGVRLEGHIDHILRRRIVLRERELIPKGLRPEVAAADSGSLGSVCQPGKWDGFGAPFGSQLHGVPGAGFHPLWGPGTSQGAAVGSLLDSSPSAMAKDLDRFGAEAGFHDFRRTGSSPTHYGGGHSGAASPPGISRGAWPGPANHLGGADQQMSLLDMLRSPGAAAAPPGHLHPHVASSGTVTCARMPAMGWNRGEGSRMLRAFPGAWCGPVCVHTACAWTPTPLFAGWLCSPYALGGVC